MKKNERPEQMDGQIKPDLDKILKELAAVLSYFGVEEFAMSESEIQSYIIEHNHPPDNKLLTLFAMHVHALYMDLAAGIS